MGEGVGGRKEGWPVERRQKDVVVHICFGNFEMEIVLFFPKYKKEEKKHFC